MQGEPGEFTTLLNQARCGLPGAAERLESLVYSKLRRLAVARLSHERQGHTLSPTALANEAWLRFSPDVALEDLENQRHLSAIAVRAMRRILVEHARARNASKRSGRLERVSVEAVDVAVENDEQLLALDEALKAFQAVSARGVRVVELKFFFGCSHDEIAALTGVQRGTVDRDLAFARAWLFGRLRRTRS